MADRRCVVGSVVALKFLSEYSECVELSVKRVRLPSQRGKLGAPASLAIP